MAETRRGRAGARLAASLLTLLPCLGGCAHGRLSKPVESHREGAGLRCLFQVRYRHQDGAGRFRLVLWENLDGFRLVGSDPLGRGLWIYDQTGDQGIWIDRRENLLCRLSGRVELLVDDFGEVPVDAIPAMLLGRSGELPPELIPRRDGDGAELTIDRVHLSWHRGHCEAAEGERPALDRFLEWPENCALATGRGE